MTNNNDHILLPNTFTIIFRNETLKACTWHFLNQSWLP